MTLENTEAIHDNIDRPDRNVEKSKAPEEMTAAELEKKIKEEQAKFIQNANKIDSKLNTL